MSEVRTTGPCAGSRVAMIPITWSFAVWGLDMVGLFKRSKDKKTHLLVAVDKFTKWVEAEPVRNCEVTTAVQFVKKLIF